MCSSDLGDARTAAHVLGEEAHRGRVGCLLGVRDEGANQVLGLFLEDALDEQRHLVARTRRAARVSGTERPAARLGFTGGFVSRRGESTLLGW